MGLGGIEMASAQAWPADGCMGIRLLFASDGMERVRNFGTRSAFLAFLLIQPKKWR